MQEEVTQRTVALRVEATKLSAGMLQQAMKKVLDEMQKGVTGHKTNPASKSQGIKQLMAGGGVALIGMILVPLLSNLLTAG